MEKIHCHYRSPSGQNCEFEWIRKTWNVTTTSCQGLEHRASFSGKQSNIVKFTETLSIRYFQETMRVTSAGSRWRGQGAETRDYGPVPSSIISSEEERDRREY